MGKRGRCAQRQLLSALHGHMDGTEEPSGGSGSLQGEASPAGREGGKGGGILETKQWGCG